MTKYQFSYTGIDNSLLEDIKNVVQSNQLDAHLNEGWEDRDEVDLKNSSGTHHKFRTVTNYKSKNDYDVYVQHWKNPDKLKDSDRGSLHYIGSSDGNPDKYSKLLKQAHRHKFRIYNRVVPSTGKEGKKDYDHAQYYNSLKEDVQLDELTKTKLYDYIVHASMDKSFSSYDLGRHQGYNHGSFNAGDKNAKNDKEYMDSLNKRHSKRSSGIQSAASKLAGNGLHPSFKSKVAATEDVAESFRVGDRVHLGFGAKGGVGYIGKLAALKDGVATIKHPSGKEYIGQERNLSTPPETYFQKASKYSRNDV